MEFKQLMKLVEAGFTKSEIATMTGAFKAPATEPPAEPAEPAQPKQPAEPAEPAQPKQPAEPMQHGAPFEELAAAMKAQQEQISSLTEIIKSGAMRAGYQSEPAVTADDITAHIINPNGTKI